MRIFLLPTRKRFLMPSFDKNKANAMYVLISFSKNRTARRLDSSIFQLRRNNLAGISVLTSRPTDNVHLRASICHAPARFLSAEPFRRRRTIPYDHDDAASGILFRKIENELNDGDDDEAVG